MLAYFLSADHSFTSSKITRAGITGSIRRLMGGGWLLVTFLFQPWQIWRKKYTVALTTLNVTSNSKS